MTRWDHLSGESEAEVEVNQCGPKKDQYGKRDNNLSNFCEFGKHDDGPYELGLIKLTTRVYPNGALCPLIVSIPMGQSIAMDQWC